MWSCGVLFHYVCYVFIYSPSPLMCTPLLLTADTSPVMDIKCFFFVSLFWTYIRDRKSISQSINRAHAGAHTHTRTHSYCIQATHSLPWQQDTVNNLKIVNELVKKEGEASAACGLRAYCATRATTWLQVQRFTWFTYFCFMEIPNAEVYKIKQNLNVV